jgi:hypothetical protein
VKFYVVVTKKIIVVHTKVLFEENGQKTLNFEELFFEIVRFR